jgi:hypothetical protein
VQLAAKKKEAKAKKEERHTAHRGSAAHAQEQGQEQRQQAQAGTQARSQIKHQCNVQLQ